MTIRINKQNPLTSDKIDVEKTFGKLLFLGEDGEQMEAVEGEYTGAIKAYRYGVKSEAQNDILNVFLPPTGERVELPYLTEVKLEGVTIVPFTSYSVSGNLMVNYKIEAGSITPVSGGNKPKPSENMKPEEGKQK